MKTIHPSLPHLLLAALFALCPGLDRAAAQDGCGCGDEPEIEIGDPKDPPKGGDYDEEKTRKKNIGLAGGGPGHDDDPNAPKVKAPLQERINVAIKNGVEWLKKRQDKSGSWGPVRANSIYGQPDVKGDFVRDELGPTAFSIYALAKCGVKNNDPVIKKGMKWLEGQTKEVFDVLGGQAPERDEASKEQRPSRGRPRVLTTYESAAIVLMIEAVHTRSAKLTGRHSKRRLYSDNPLKPPARSRIPKKVWRHMHDRIIHLTVGRRGGRKGRTIKGTQNRQGKNAGGWRYGQASGDADLSATQFVLLALRAASQAGYPVEKTAPNVWDDAAKYVKACQKSDGGFGYQVGGAPTGSMTACGVACLAICKEQIELVGRTPPAWMEGAIKAGMGWLDENFDATRNPHQHGSGHLYYYLYGIERVGDLTGRKEFNGKDWYVRGAEFLLERQDADGKWVDGTAFRPHDVLGTCFALLFLKRATPPTVTMRRDE